MYNMYQVKIRVPKCCTVNSENFKRVLFLGKYAKYLKIKLSRYGKINKTLAKWQDHFAVY